MLIEGGQPELDVPAGPVEINQRGKTHGVKKMTRDWTHAISDLVQSTGRAQTNKCLRHGVAVLNWGGGASAM